MKIKLLFVCSYNVDRSRAAEAMFKNSNKYKSKSAGIDPRATKLVSKEDVKWADIIFVMDERNEGHKLELVDRFGGFVEMNIIILGIPNHFRRYDPELYRLLRVRLEKEGIDIDETNYEDFIEGHEEKKEFELFGGEEVDKEMDNKFQIKTNGFGMGATVMSSQLLKELLLKNQIKTPEEEAKLKEEKAKKKKIREDNRMGWVK